ncbi:MAG: hypothetical protein IKR84_05180 [Oscillibacter sp.]|nr:hypothetical protein [Oscillibacter sp.]
MRFVRLPAEDAQTERPSPDWPAAYRAGRRIGVISLGEQSLFFRKGWTVYALPYARLSRYFRRVLAVPARIGCCAGGELRIEHLVLCAVDPASGVEKELAQIQLPGERAAKAVMNELRVLAPEAASGRPAQVAEGGDAP